MHVIIAGCGRVGAQLAQRLDRDGNAVVVVDKDPAAFRRLGEDFHGHTVQGFVFDRGTLDQAGARQSQAFVAVTSGDNSNILSARIARDHYGIERVVARIYDPERARIYERLGVTTIASARWTAESILMALFGDGHEDAEVPLGPGASEVVVLTMTVPEGVHGLAVDDITVSGEVSVAAVTRGDATRIPTVGQLLEAGDCLHLAVDQALVDRVRARIRSLAEDVGGGRRAARERWSRQRAGGS